MILAEKDILRKERLQLPSITGLVLDKFRL